jgi:hypothetical protein
VTVGGFDVRVIVGGIGVAGGAHAVKKLARIAKPAKTDLINLFMT